jgi:hypothetical protein
VDGLQINDERVIKVDPEIVEIVGDWNLLMQGAERLDVERRYQSLTNGPAVKLTNLNGPIVWQSGGTYCQLKTRFLPGERFEELDDEKPEDSTSL